MTQSKAKLSVDGNDIDAEMQRPRSPARADHTGPQQAKCLDDAHTPDPRESRVILREKYNNLSIIAMHTRHAGAGRPGNRPAGQEARACSNSAIATLTAGRRPMGRGGG